VTITIVARTHRALSENGTIATVLHMMFSRIFERGTVGRAAGEFARSFFEVIAVYNEFKSPASQKGHREKLLPLAPPAEAVQGTRPPTFEPRPRRPGRSHADILVGRIMDNIPRIQAAHSASMDHRMLAATKERGQVIDALTLYYNTGTSVDYYQGTPGKSFPAAEALRLT